MIWKDKGFTGEAGHWVTEEGKENYVITEKKFGENEAFRVLCATLYSIPMKSP